MGSLDARLTFSPSSSIAVQAAIEIEASRELLPTYSGLVEGCPPVDFTLIKVSKFPVGSMIPARPFFFLSKFDILHHLGLLLRMKQVSTLRLVGQAIPCLQETLWTLDIGMVTHILNFSRSFFFLDFYICVYIFCNILWTENCNS